MATICLLCGCHGVLKVLLAAHRPAVEEQKQSVKR